MFRIRAIIFRVIICLVLYFCLYALCQWFIRRVEARGHGTESNCSGDYVKTKNEEPYKTIENLLTDNLPLKVREPCFALFNINLINFNQKQNFNRTKVNKRELFESKFQNVSLGRLTFGLLKLMDSSYKEVSLINVTFTNIVVSGKKLIPGEYDNIWLESISFSDLSGEQFFKNPTKRLCDLPFTTLTIGQCRLLSGLNTCLYYESMDVGEKHSDFNLSKETKSENVGMNEDNDDSSTKTNKNNKLGGGKNKGKTNKTEKSTLMIVKSGKNFKEKTSETITTIYSEPTKPINKTTGILISSTSTECTCSSSKPAPPFAIKSTKCACTCPMSNSTLDAFTVCTGKCSLSELSSKSPSTSSVILSTSIKPTTQTAKPLTQTAKLTTQSAKPTTQVTKPTTQAAKPTTQAAKPTTQAAKPTTQAAKPTTQDAKTTTQAAKPTTQDAKPTTQAAKPTTQAAKPTTQAAKPTTQAAKPTTQAAKPTTQAAKPTTQAAKLTTQPAKPTIQAAKPTTQAAKLTTQTAKPTTEVAKPTAQASKISTQAAKITTQAAKITTQTAKPTTEAAKLTAQASKISTQAAKITTQAAKITTQAAKLTAQAAKLTTKLTSQTVKLKSLSSVNETTTKYSSLNDELTTRPDSFFPLILSSHNATTKTYFYTNLISTKFPELSTIYIPPVAKYPSNLVAARSPVINSNEVSNFDIEIDPSILAVLEDDQWIMARSGVNDLFHPRSILYARKRCYLILKCVILGNLTLPEVKVEAGIMLGGKVTGGTIRNGLLENVTLTNGLINGIKFSQKDIRGDFMFYTEDVLLLRNGTLVNGTIGINNTICGVVTGGYLTRLPVNASDENVTESTVLSPTRDQLYKDFCPYSHPTSQRWYISPRCNNSDFNYDNMIRCISLGRAANYPTACTDWECPTWITPECSSPSTTRRCRTSTVCLTTWICMTVPSTTCMTTFQVITKCFQPPVPVTACYTIPTTTTTCPTTTTTTCPSTTITICPTTTTTTCSTTTPTTTPTVYCRTSSTTTCPTTTITICPTTTTTTCSTTTPTTTPTIYCPTSSTDCPITTACKQAACKNH